MIDTHTHLNFSAFSNDWREVVNRAVDAGVEKMIVVGTDIDSSKRAVTLAHEHPALYASIGVHPHHARGLLDQQAELKLIEKNLVQLAENPKVVAIGEIGLDNHVYGKSKYTFTSSTKDTDRVTRLQKKLFILQLKLAQKLDLPVILHSREAREGVLELIMDQQERTVKSVRGVFHCFEGSKRYLYKILDSGFYISFTGNISYSSDRFEVSRSVPLDRLLLETDSPLISPKPNRGERNEPCYVKIIANCQAQSHGVQLSKVDTVTTKNAHQLFRL